MLKDPRKRYLLDYLNFSSAGWSVGHSDVIPMAVFTKRPYNYEDVTLSEISIDEDAVDEDSYHPTAQW